MRVLLCQGEGLILSTPRGSTALSAAAGASLVHPLVPALLATPLCPAPSLAARAVVLPAGAELRVAVRGTPVWLTFDGGRGLQLGAGGSLRVIAEAASSVDTSAEVIPSYHLHLILVEKFLNQYNYVSI